MKRKFKFFHFNITFGHNLSIPRELLNVPENRTLFSRGFRFIFLFSRLPTRARTQQPAVPLLSYFYSYLSISLPKLAWKTLASAEESDIKIKQYYHSLLILISASKRNKPQHFVSIFFYFSTVFYVFLVIFVFIVIPSLFTRTQYELSNIYINALPTNSPLQHMRTSNTDCKHRTILLHWHSINCNNRKRFIGIFVFVFSRFFSYLLSPLNIFTTKWHNISTTTLE